MSRNVSRRSFLKTASAGSVLALGRPVFAEAAPPKIRIAAIGTGGQAHGDLSNFLNTGMAEIVCAADVFEDSLQWLRQRQPNAKFFKDYREMLRTCAGQFDAVTIVVPDHSHCAAFLEAAKYKVPVFCEKPLGHTFIETLTMMRKAEELNLITHVGMQGNSDHATPTLREWMESGELGAAKEAHIYCNAVPFFYKVDPNLINQAAPVPNGLDWEHWQGPVKRRPFFPTVAPGGKWRSWWPYGEGCMTDWCCHILGPLVTALDLDLPVAVTVDSPTFDPAKTPFAFPMDPRYTFEFAAKGNRAPFKVYWYDVNRTAPRPAALEADQPFDPIKAQQAGAWVLCEKETLMYGSHGAGGLHIVPQSRMAAFKRPPKTYPRGKNHYAEFLLAIREKRPASTPFSLAGKVSAMGLLGTIATRFPGRRLTFDATAMRFTNCPEANGLLGPDWTPEAMAAYGSDLVMV